MARIMRLNKGRRFCNDHVHINDDYKQLSMNNDLLRDVGVLVSSMSELNIYRKYNISNISVQRRLHIASQSNFRCPVRDSRRCNVSCP